MVVIELNRKRSSTETNCVSRLTRPTTAPCGSPVRPVDRFRDSRLELLIGNVVRLPRSRNAPEDLPVNGGDQDTPESLNTRRRLLSMGPLARQEAVDRRPGSSFRLPN